MSHQVFDDLISAVEQLFIQRPSLSDFSPFPNDLRWANRRAHNGTAAALLEQWEAEGSHPEDDVHKAVQAAAPFAEWRQSYTEQQVGADFLANYGYFELYGPKGHYHCETSRGFFAYWGPGLNYGWHHHAPEELYFVISGNALFRSEGEADAQLSRGETRQHRAWQSHAMDTLEQPLLAFAVWQGDELAQLPLMQEN